MTFYTSTLRTRPIGCNKTRSSTHALGCPTPPPPPIPAAVHTNALRLTDPELTMPSQFQPAKVLGILNKFLQPTPRGILPNCHFPATLMHGASLHRLLSGIKTHIERCYPYIRGQESVGKATELHLFAPKKQTTQNH